MRRVLVGGLVLLALAAVSAAVGARGFSDAAGDVNMAPDITSLDVSEAAAGVLALKLSVGNFQTLPANSWVNLWFDTDSNAQTGDEGDEALVRYLSTGAVELFVWDGSRFVEGSTAGVSASFGAGTLTLSVPRASIDATGPVGILAVTSRAQVIGNEQLVASDFAPDVGRAAYSGPVLVTFPDAVNDHDAAPDITAVRVSDSKNGWVTFSITTPNYATLPSGSVIVLTIDVDDNRRTGEAGAEVRLNMVGGELALERWDARTRDWLPDDLPTRARFRNAGNVVAIDIHVSELDNTRRLGFSLLAVDVNTAILEVLAVDFAPDNGAYWRYTLASRAALTLAARAPVATPPSPAAGKPFAVAISVTRSDSGRPIVSGSADCRVFVGGSRVSAKGAVVRGSARCTFVVPASAKGKTLRGTITVRSGGARVARGFAYTVR